MITITAVEIIFPEWVVIVLVILLIVLISAQLIKIGLSIRILYLERDAIRQKIRNDVLKELGK